MILEQDDPKTSSEGNGNGSDTGSTSTETHRDGGTTVPKTEI